MEQVFDGSDQVFLHEFEFDYRNIPIVGIIRRDEYGSLQTFGGHMLINITDLMDEDQCYDLIRETRWPEGRACAFCDSKAVIRRGFDEVERARQRYECKSCKRRFDDLTGTIFSGRHQSLKVWITCLYLMGLNLSGEQIAKELGLNKDDVFKMVSELRAGIVKKSQKNS